MTIVFLIRTLTFGGAERQLVALARGLHQRGHRVSVMVFYPGGPLESDLKAAGIPVLSVDKRGRWDFFGFVRRLGRALRAERPDIVHGYLGASNALSLVLKPIHRGKSVWGIRDSGINLNRGDWFGHAERLTERGLSRFADLIVANSHSGRNNVLTRGFPEKTTIVIPNGIDTDRFRPDSHGRRRVRAEFGIGESELLIGRVGRLDPQKDYPTFLRAAVIIARARPEARFVCVGSGTSYTEVMLKELSSEFGLDGRVLWVSARSDMPAIYSAMDLCLSSSAFGEGTPNVIAEAMGCGVPCVATDIGDSAIVVGDAKRIVPKADPDALARAAIAILDEISNVGVDHDALRESIIDSLSLTALIDRTEEALRSIARPGARERQDLSEAGT